MKSYHVLVIPLMSFISLLLNNMIFLLKTLKKLLQR